MVESRELQPGQGRLKPAEEEEELEEEVMLYSSNSFRTRVLSSFLIYSAGKLAPIDATSFTSQRFGGYEVVAIVATIHGKEGLFAQCAWFAGHNVDWFWARLPIVQRLEGKLYADLWEQSLAGAGPAYQAAKTGMWPTTGPRPPWWDDRWSQQWPFEDHSHLKRRASGDLAVEPGHIFGPNDAAGVPARKWLRLGPKGDRSRPGEPLSHLHHTTPWQLTRDAGMFPSIAPHKESRQEWRNNSQTATVWFGQNPEARQYATRSFWGDKDAQYNMSTRFSSGLSTQVLDFEQKKARAESVLDAIARSHGVMVVCGPGTLVASGIMPEKEQVKLVRGDAEANTSLMSLLKECSSVRASGSELREDTLGLFNMAMTRRRLQASAAPGNQFHRYLGRVCKSGNLVRCLTANLDGMEGRDYPDIEQRLVMMRGDNRVSDGAALGRANRLLRALYISSPALGQSRKLLRDAQRPTFPLLNHKAYQPLTVPAVSWSDLGLTFSNPLTLVHQWQRWRAGPPNVVRGLLRDGFYDRRFKTGFRVNCSPVRTVPFAEQCRLLIVAGVSLRCNDTFDLVYELGCKIKELGGAVVYIDSQPIRGRNTEHCFDFHLRMDVDAAAAWILQRIDEPLILGEGPASKEESEEIWNDVIQNELKPEEAQEPQDYREPLCYRCNLAITERLLQCLGCGKYICGKRPRSDPENKSLPVKLETCVELNRFSAGPSSSALDEADSTFICADCWNHSGDLYPHFVRPVRRLTIEQKGQAAPKMAMVVYYLDQFWPQAKHLCSVVLSRWQNHGWTCLVEPVKLDELSDYPVLFEKCDWEATSFNLYVIYLTHGLSNGNGYQISGKESCPPVERLAQFFERSTKNIRHLAERAHTVRAMMLCCGHPFMSPQQTKDMQQWLNRAGVFDTLTGCLNLKLAPGFMLSLVARMSIALMAESQWEVNHMFTCWLSDGIACNHSDLIVMVKNQPPVMWLFSPFDSRPLGKELPGLLSVCSCPQLDTWVNGQERRKRRKVWLVKHDAADGKLLKDVEVRAMCSVCLQTWVLPTDHLQGELRKACGLYAAVVPYFALG
ncbi:hypothetical protein BDV93DRAFT_514897 [Ceratobasidium sp. AG-I]|nr:hypothetical protein BDV93DRAFT_514897 [Ceratobasidium sp. AG-I]